MKTAELMREGTSPVGARWKLYRLSPPMADDFGQMREYVRVSAAPAREGLSPQVIIFAADESGKIIHYTEMGGSYWEPSGDHEAALVDLGYEVRGKGVLGGC